ncbi:MAG TPA: HD domain-containing protein, partial [Spirochaetota bacterium]|nr:HD domain-containing protein [Spirochaetota bacterium]
ALKFFDATSEIHHLGNQERSYLIAASILHDVGISVSARSHHKHSLYVINAQEFFYLSDEEKNIVANIARYHRRSAPKTTHIDFMKLCEKDKMTVIKLASILRIADSLDNSGLQVINSIQTKIENDKLLITAQVIGDPLAEIYSFKYKKELFEDFFGISIKLNIIRK